MSYVILGHNPHGDNVHFFKGVMSPTTSDIIPIFIMGIMTDNFPDITPKIKMGIMSEVVCDITPLKNGHYPNGNKPLA